MKDQKDFTDYIHIEKIREKLWIRPEFGQASVMVGTGFSRNSEKTSQAINNFPLWNELSDKMYYSLYPNSNEEEKKKKGVNSISGALRLASEYEAEFKRDALNNLLKETIPDTKYFPGNLHKLLLSLPWADVFTTNYDTLLERTLPQVHNIKYNVIYNSKDIPSKSQPRIIKLHGSFPSHYPFIITEEDYRTYPTDFAPFVNTVQQSIMENILCLVGFSGDDPNFLYWTGWVRDNLGRNAPTVYLCGLLNLSSSQKKLLESRNVIPIDLSPLFPSSEWSDSNVRYSRALEWFLLTLMEGKPPNRLYWPELLNESKWEPRSTGLPLIPANNRDLNEDELDRPSSTKRLGIDDLRVLCEKWQRKRKEYPGWIVTPKNNRDKLWRCTQDWVIPILNSIDDLPYIENISLLYELNWRFEKVFLPFLKPLDEKIRDVVNAFNPFPSLIEIHDARIRPDIDEYKNLDWNSLNIYWIELVFALARDAREENDESRFSLWINKLENIVNQNIEWQSRWFYEKSLFYISMLDQDKLKDTLKEWPVKDNLPFWEARRASLLYELGEINKAEEIAEKALTEIRNRLQSNKEDISLLSQEGWIMMLLQSITLNKREANFVEQYRERWEKLGNYRANPWTEIESLDAILRGPLPNPTPWKEKTIKSFDPRKVTITHSFNSGLNIAEYIPGFALFRIIEEVGLPFNHFSDRVRNAIKWIEPVAAHLSVGVLLRLGNDKCIEDIYNRVYVAGLAENEIGRLNKMLIKSLKQSIKYLSSITQRLDLFTPSFAQRQVRSSSELLSRICFRLSNEQLTDLLNITIEIYRSTLFSRSHLLYESVSKLFERILYAAPETVILGMMTELLSLPIPDESESKVELVKWWPEPFEYIEWERNTNLRPDFDRREWTDPINKLILTVKNGTINARQRAIMRLIKLNSISALTIEEGRNFGEALWSRNDLDTNLPADTNLFPSSFIHLPEPNKGQSKEHIHKYLLSRDFVRLVTKTVSPEGKMNKSISGNHGNDYLDELIRVTLPLFIDKEENKQKYIDWTCSDAVQLLEKAAKWWDYDKDEIKEKSEERFSDWFSDDIRKQYSSILVLMAEIILPRLKDSNDNAKELALRILSEMENKGFCVLFALPMTLFIVKDSVNDSAIKLRIGLNSVKENENREAISGVYYWLIYGQRKYIPMPPQDLIDELINKIVSRRQPALYEALSVMFNIVIHLPEIINDKYIDSLCIALEYLIKDTELPSIEEKREIENAGVIIPIDYRPDYRALSAKLAYSLFKYLSNRDIAIPKVLNEWEKICSTDTLPEVRKMWDSGF